MRVLIIEDNPDIAANLGDYLEDHGHTVDFAGDGVTGLHLAVVNDFDSIVLDPPKFADSRGQLARAARGYKDINLLAFKLLRPGGTLATFSCSGLLAPELFQKIVADAALDAGRDARIERWLAQGDDHPVALPFPEGRYLKGLVCRAW